VGLSLNEQLKLSFTIQANAGLNSYSHAYGCNVKVILYKKYTAQRVLILTALNRQTVGWAPGHPRLQVYAKLMTKNDYCLLNNDD